MSSDSRVSVRVLHAPKEGNSEAEYEDAFAVVEPDAAAPPETRLTVAVADGASSAVFARQWAHLLVNAFAAAPPEADDEAAVQARIAHLGQEWRGQVAGVGKLPWYAEEKLPHGSHAALLVVTWEWTAGKPRCRAQAVGDACLFVVRNDGLHNGFPVTKSAAFDDRPALISTEGASGPTFARFEAPVEAGDRFFLMTDALAAWFLAEREAGRKPWNALPPDNAALAPWLQTLRDTRAIKNDDVTLIEVGLPAVPAVAP